MGTNETAAIILKFQALKSKLDSIIEETNWWSFENKFDTFLEKLDGEINPLPNSPETICEIYAWISILSDRIEKTKKAASPSSLASSRLSYRKKLKEKLVEIRTVLIKENSIEGKDEQDKEQSLTLKQQILLLKAVGILDLENLKSLPLTKQAIFFSSLLGCGNKRVKDILTYIDRKTSSPDFFIYKDDNIKKVNELLESIDLQKYRIVK
jgi:hypothetical protein